MKPLISGGTGFIGSELAGILMRNGVKPVLLDPAPPRGRLMGVKGFDYTAADLSSLATLREIIRKYEVDTIFHLGGMLSMPCEHDPNKAFDVNVAGTHNIMEASRLEGAGLFIYASSIAVYSDDLPQSPINDDTLQRPNSMYGTTKVFGELLGPILCQALRDGFPRPARSFGGGAGFKSAAHVHLQLLGH